MRIFDAVMLVPFIPLTVLMYVLAVITLREYWVTKSANASKVFWVYTAAVIVGTAIVGVLLQQLFG